MDATGLKAAGKVLKESLYDSGDGYPYTPAYFEFIASSVIGAYLTARGGSSEFVVVDREKLTAIIDESYASLDLANTKNPSVAAILVELSAALKDQQ